MSAVASPTEARTTERTLGRYVVLEKLGTGGMGVVYRARDESSGRVVALKQLRSSLAAEKRRTVEALFEREYHTLAGLKHPRIIEVYDYGRADDGPYYTMELLPGQDLRELAPLRYEDTCKHVRDVASSLALLHTHRLIHRDVSPRNVRISEAGRAKLIDFGALMSFGTTQTVIGTPPCVAPEIVNWMPLDHRTDLFALGALFYWTLTGRHAFPARTFDELGRAWKRVPLPPSALAEGIPRALDDLVLSLLSLDPLGRPVSAAAVIDRLNAIGNLDPGDEHHAAQSYLRSSSMVGRNAEFGRLTKRVADAMLGHGASVIIEGATGIGKSRLLHEICLKAQLMDVTVVRADAETTTGSFGVARMLASNVLHVAPDVALEMARPHREVLGHLIEPLAESLGEGDLEPLPEDLGERRARLQTALHAWFLAMARARPLVLAVDNFHAADDSSAVFVAALGRETRNHPIVVIATNRSGAEAVAPVAMEALVGKSTRLKLTGLDRSGSEALVTGVFGSVLNSGRLARWLHDRSGGNPQQSMQFVQQLVAKNIVKYVDGSWVLPLDVSPEEVPARFDELLEARLTTLSESARELAEALAVHGKPMPIERCLTLVQKLNEERVHRVLDELVAEEILVCEGDAYRFSNEGTREAVLRRIDDGRRRAMHRQVADVLLSTAADDVRVQLEAAWHLLSGGEETRGADLLAIIGRRLVASTNNVENDAAPAVRALIAALAVYDKQNRSEYELAPLLLALMQLSFYVDWRLAPKYGERALDIGFRISGLALASKLRRFFGKKLALVIALMIASVQFKQRQKRGLSYTLREAIVGVCAAVPGVMGVFSICLDRAGVERILKLAEPLGLFGEDHIAGVIHNHCVSRVLLTCGREVEARDVLERTSKRLADPRFGQDLGAARRRGFYAAELFPLAILHTSMLEDGALKIADELSRLDIRLWAMVADQLRMMHYAGRGEIERAQEFLDRTELHVLQGGTTWQTDIFLPAHMFALSFLTGDVMAVRQSWEQLARRSREIPSLQLYADGAHAGYLALRGDLKAAISKFEAVVSKIAPKQQIGWVTVRLHLCHVLIAAGEHARARRVVLDAMSFISPADREFLFPYTDASRYLALAEAGLGNHAEATRILDELLARYEQEDHPLFVGLLHKARAEVALAMNDGEAFGMHLDETERLFRGTKNPTLVAQWERLAEEGVRAGLRESARPAYEPTAREALLPASTVGQILSECRTPAERWGRAIELVMKQMKARAAYLYALRTARLDLLGAHPDDEPPLAVQQALSELLERSRVRQQDRERLEIRSEANVSPLADATEDDEDTRTMSVVPDTAQERQVGDHRLIALSTTSGERRTVVGGIVVLLDRPSTPTAGEYLDAIAAAVAGGESCALEFESNGNPP